MDERQQLSFCDLINNMCFFLFQLARTTKSTAMGEFDKMKNMQKLATFTLDMMDQERKKNTAQDDIMKKTTTFSQVSKQHHMTVLLQEEAIPSSSFFTATYTNRGKA